MVCLKCGKKVEKDDEVCPNCGWRLKSDPKAPRRFVDGIDGDIRGGVQNEGKGSKAALIFVIICGVIVTLGFLFVISQFFLARSFFSSFDVDGFWNGVGGFFSNFN